MAKKKEVSKKQATAPKKTQAPARKIHAPAQKTDAPATVTEHNGTHQQNIPLLPPSLMEETMESLKYLLDDFTDIANNNLTALQRRRKIGPGTRNYGFIDKVSDLAETNPQYAQFFKVQDLKNCIRNVETCRSLAVLLQSFLRSVINTMLIYSDDAYSMSLIYYNLVKEMDKRGDPTAMELYRILKTYFKRTKSVSAEQTEKELMHDINAVMHGKADGKIEIVNERPKITAGKRIVVDEVKRGKAIIKGSEEADIDDSKR